jgi:hypothetical protein
MPELSQSNKVRRMGVGRRSNQWETPQITTKQLGTKVYGGKAPSEQDIIKSANARGGSRHDMKGQMLADVGVLADSDKLVNDERVGIHNHDYLVKKNLQFGPDVFYNTLPPGMDIEDQENCDIRAMEFKTITSMGYRDDGWADNEESKELDRGRPQTTNYRGGKGT